MRKLGLIAAAAAIALGGSVVNADFVVTHARQSNAFSIGAQSYDIVTWTVSNNGANGTGDTLGTFDEAFYAPGTGMIVGLTPSGANNTHKPDVFGISTEASKPQDSWINGTLANLSPIKTGAPILTVSGGVFSTDSAAAGGVYTNVYTDQETVAGISGTITASPGNGPNINPSDGGTAVVFAQIVVPHNGEVDLLAPNATARGNLPTTFENKASGFASDSQSGDGSNGTFLALPSTIVDAVAPEPASLGLLGIAAMGLLSRRRHA